MADQDLLLTAFNQRYNQYLAERKHCKAEFSEEAVHDLRVSIRRMLAMLELLRALATSQPSKNAQPRLQKLSRAFKNQLDSLDQLRDTQVILTEITESLEALPELSPLQKFLQKREKRLLKAAEREVRDFKISAIANRSENLRAGLAKPAASQNLSARLLAAVDEAYLTVTRRYARIDPAKTATIHRVRVAFKKFRYMVELAHPFLSDFPAKNFTEMHSYQGLMGNIQDVEVLLQTISTFAKKNKDFELLPIQAFYQKHHTEALAAYLGELGQLDRFWRPAPDQPFPWEHQK